MYLRIYSELSSSPSSSIGSISKSFVNMIPLSWEHMLSLGILRYMIASVTLNLIVSRLEATYAPAILTPTTTSIGVFI